MGLKFGDTAGKAKKGVASYKFKDGENTVRLVGEIVPRYMYWVKTNEGKDVPLECLAFSREEEKFTNVEKDWVKHYFPDLKCSWAYVILGYDVADPSKLEVINLKKKLFEQVLVAAEDLGDPTNLDTGWPIVFKKVKTGSMAFNVEYTLQVLKIKPSPVPESVRELLAASAGIDELVPRQTADEQLAFIKANLLGNQESASSDTGGVDEEVDDIPQ